MKWLVVWALVLLMGFGMMLASYYLLQGPQRAATAQLVKELKDSNKTDSAVAASERSSRGTARLLVTSTRVPRGPFELYLFGQALVLLGGSALIIMLYGYLSRHLTGDVLGAPLREVANWRSLLIVLHAGFFGILILLSQVAYALPDFQQQALAMIEKQVRGGPGPLGVAGAAYLSRSIPLAALTTLAVNLLLGTLLFITLPSLIVPGVGTGLVFFRFAIWGFLLAPTYATLGGRMLPHTFTLLAEGEAYILSAFFASLIPVYLFSRSRGASVGERYGQAFLVNAKGALWVAAILAIAGTYEAIEVIAQLP